MSEVARRSHCWRRTILSFASGALSVILLLVVAYFGIRNFDTGGRLPERQAKSEAELAARFAADMKDAADENRADIAHHVQTLYARQQRDPNATLDFLLLSGGGDRGAFGAGFLLGWASVEGGNAMPEFVGVSGVSAGALIAPFAFLGTKADLEMIDRLVRDPKPDWVVRRGMFFFLPENASLADVPGLARDLRSKVDLKMAERIARAGADGQRVLLIQATDLDNSTARAFDAVAAARKAVAKGDPKRERHLWRDMAAPASQRTDSQDALLGDHQRVHSAESGHVAADVAGDHRAQHLRVGALGGSDCAASSIRDRGGDEVTRRWRRRSALDRRAANLEAPQRSTLR